MPNGDEFSMSDVGEIAGAVGDVAGAIGGDGGGGQTGTQRQGQTSACTPESVAVEMELGFRDPEGRLNQRGRDEGIPECAASVRSAGVRLYEESQGQTGGRMQGPPSPPAGGQQTSGYPEAPTGQFAASLAGAHLPPSMELSYVPDSWVSWAVGIARFIKDKMGFDGAQAILSAIAGALGRRLNPSTLPRHCAAELVDELPDEWARVVRLWQCGAEEPYGAGEEGQLLWLALQIATSSFDMKTQTDCGCV